MAENPVGPWNDFTPSPPVAEAPPWQDFGGDGPWKDFSQEPTPTPAPESISPADQMEADADAYFKSRESLSPRARRATANQVQMVYDEAGQPKLEKVPEVVIPERAARDFGPAPVPLTEEQFQNPEVVAAHTKATTDYFDRVRQGAEDDRRNAEMMPQPTLWESMKAGVQAGRDEFRYNAERSPLILPQKIAELGAAQDAAQVRQALTLLGQNPDKPTGAAAVISGVSRGAHAAVTGLVEPENLAIMGGSLPGIAGRMVSLGFTADILSGVPDQIEQFNAAHKAGDLEGQAEALTGIVTSALFAGMAAKHGLGPEQHAVVEDTVRKILEPEVAPQPEQTSPPPVPFERPVYQPATPEEIDILTGKMNRLSKPKRVSEPPPVPTEPESVRPPATTAEVLGKPVESKPVVDQMRDFIREKQAEAGWNPKWPFVPADFLNKDFPELIGKDPSIPAEEKEKIFSAASKILGFDVDPTEDVSALPPLTPEQSANLEASEKAGTIQPRGQARLDAYRKTVGAEPATAAPANQVFRVPDAGAAVVSDPLNVFIQGVTSGAIRTTEAARDFGRTVKTPEEIATLKKVEESAKARAGLGSITDKSTPAEQDAAAAQAQRPQIINESIEAATGAYDVKSDPVAYKKLMDAGLPRSKEVIPNGQEKNGQEEGVMKPKSAAREFKKQFTPEQWKQLQKDPKFNALYDERQLGGAQERAAVLLKPEPAAGPRPVAAVDLQPNSLPEPDLKAKDINAPAQAWVDKLASGARGDNSQSKTATQKSVIVRDHDTGKLLEIGIYNPENPKLVNPKAVESKSRKAPNGLDPLKFFRTKSKQEGVDLRYEVVGTVLYSEAKAGVHREITPAEFDTLAEGKVIKPPEPTAVGVENKQAVPVVEHTGAAGPEPLSELESWLRSKLQDKKTGRLKPITPDGALGLATNFALSEPESALEIAVELGTPLAKEKRFTDLSRDAQREEVRKLFASRIYELVARQYEDQTGRLGQGDRQGARPAPTETAPAVDIESVNQPAGSAQGAQSAEVSVADKAIAKLESLKVGQGKLYLLPDLGLSATLWNGMLDAAKVGVRLGESIANQVQRGIDWLKEQKATFDEAKVRDTLTTELGQVTTQVSGAPVKILDRIKATSLPEQVAYTEKAFADFGIPVKRVDKADTRLEGNPVKTQFRFDFKPGGENYNTEASRLADEIESVIKSNDPVAKANLSNLTTSIANSIRDGEADVIGKDGRPMISDALRYRLFNLAQGPISEEAQRLSLRGWHSFDPEDDLEKVRDLPVSLRNVYSESYDGKGIASVMESLTRVFRSYFTPEIVDSILEQLQLDPRIVKSVSDLLEVNRSDLSHIEDDIAQRLQKEFAFHKEQAEQAAHAIFTLLDKRFSSAADNALKAVQSGLAGEQVKTFKKGGSLWEAIQSAARRKVFDPGTVLEDLAKKMGDFPTPTPEQKARLRHMIDKEEYLRTPTQRQIDEAGGDIVAATKVAEDATLDDRLKLIREIQANWSRWSKPVKILKHFGDNEDIRRNNAAAANEAIQANLLTTATFPVRQSVDVVVSMVLHSINRSIVHVMERAESEGGFSAETTSDLFTALKEMLKARGESLKSSLQQAGRVLAGGATRKLLERTTHNIGIFERMRAKAQEMEDGGNKAGANALRMATILETGYRVAGAGDALQSVGLERQEMRQQLSTELRKMGVPRPLIQERMAEVFDRLALDLEWARQEVLLSDAERGVEKRGQSSLDITAWNLAKAKAYDRMMSLTSGRVNFRAENELLMELHSWNIPISGGVGGLITKTINSLKSGTEKMGVPTGGIFSFGSASGTAADRMLTFAGFGLAPKSWRKAIFGDSPWHQGERNIRQRKIEAMQGLGTMAILYGFAMAGKILVQTQYPDGKEEKERFIAEGHKLNTIRWMNDDGTWVEVPITAAPFSYIAAPLYMLGEWQRRLASRHKEQEKLNEEAARTGAVAGQARRIGVGDYLSVLAQGMLGLLTGGRTANSKVQALSDLGEFNLNKSAAGFLQPYVPLLPAWSGVARMMGAAPDPKTASFLELFVPSPWSAHQRVNSLGDPMVTPDNVVRTLQVLTGGMGYGSDKAANEKEAHAYQQLFASGYSPPAINPQKGYDFNGTVRPMTGQELEAYTVARGVTFKRELDSVNTDGLTEAEAKQQVQAAFNRANQQALSEVGVTTPKPTGTGRSGGSSASIGGGGASLGSGFPGGGLGSGGGFGGGNRLRGSTGSAFAGGLGGRGGLAPSRIGATKTPKLAGAVSNRLSVKRSVRKIGRPRGVGGVKHRSIPKIGQVRKLKG